MLEIVDVSKRKGNFSMKNISIQLPDGYIMGLVGANGSGKTTLIKMLLGIFTPDSGSIRVDGREYGSEEHGIREDIGYVLQEELFDPGLSAEENVDYYGHYYSRYDKELCRKYMEEFELGSSRKYKVLSKGEKLKLQLAFALAHKPKYLIMDEPAGNFDPDFAKIFYRMLTDFVSDGEHSVLLSTHQTEGLERVVDYVTFLQKGELLFSENIETLHSRYKMIRGESYKIKLLPKERIIYMEEGEYGAKALVVNSRLHPFDATLVVEDATIEEMMYFMTKGGRI
ncbi:ABC transporter ATP-binding protein [Roseburia sp. 499]|uniref:ABC transporter ATP-binding protein n=1 Tax=Roseburia sp. 499 TaxID=1261634 RepID=UPI0009510D59|nr:ABC transporter ATP-binding protein [Roseburia sp. 499]WVK68996.1 ABC transporter ATP-binding protein [Roseburia sp. 499]